MRFLFLVFLFASLFGYAQHGKIKMQVGKESFNVPPISYTAPEPDYTFWDKTNGWQYLVRPHRTNYFIASSFDTTLIANINATIPVDEVDDNFRDKNFLQTATKYLWFYCFWDTRSKQDILCYKEYDYKRQAFKMKPVPILQNDRLFEIIDFPGIIPTSYENKYAFFASKDKTKNLIAYQLFPDRGRPEKWMADYGFTVFDGDFQKLWSLYFNGPYLWEIMEIKNINISNSGEVFILIKIYDGKKKEFDREGNPNYRFEILRFTKGVSKPTIIPIDNQSKFINEFYISEKEPNVFHFHGYYADNKKTENMDGSYFFELDANKKDNPITKQMFYPFKDFFNKALASQNKNISSNELYENYSIGFLNFNSIAYTQEGGYYVLGEVGYMSADQGGPSLNYTKKMLNFLSDIYISKFDSKHNLIWIRSIPKDQKIGLYYTVLSFNYLQDQSDLHFFYFDHPKNLSRSEDKPPLQYVGDVGGMLFHTKMDTEGNFSSEMFEDYKGENARLDIKNFLRINKNRTLIGKVYSPKFKDRAVKIWLE